MANTDEPAYMLQARAYARDGLGKPSTLTLASLVHRIDRLEKENSRLRADLADTVEAALQLP